MKKIVCALIIVILLGGAVYAMNIDGVKQHFLKGEWKDAIREGEKLLAGAVRDSSDLDQLYYYLGLCYFKDGQFLRSADIFEIIIKEFPKSRFVEHALYASIESYGSAGDYDAAVRKSQEFLQSYPQSPYASGVARQTALYKNRTGIQAKAVPATIAHPAGEEGPDVVLASDLMSGNATVPAASSFWVQVGAFSSDRNADNLAAKLTAASYTTIVARAVSKGKSVYKVRVGPYPTREEALTLSKKLSLQGYPTKVVP